MVNKFFVIISLVFFSSWSQAEEIVSPYDLILESTSKVIAYMEFAPKEKDAKERHAFVIIEQAVIPSLDFLSMTKLAVGKYWRKTNDVQQQRLYDEFRKLLTRTYLKVFTKFDNLKVEVLPFKAGQRPDRALVKTEVKHGNGLTSIDYKFRLTKESKWLVYDIKVEGISLVTNYRSSFNAEISRRGIGGLIQLLVDKNLQSS